MGLLKLLNTGKTLVGLTDKLVTKVPWAKTCRTSTPVLAR